MGGEEPKIKDEITKKKARPSAAILDFAARRIQKNGKTEKKTKIEWNQSAARVFFCLLLELEGVAFQYLCGTFLGRRHLELELLS